MNTQESVIEEVVTFVEIIPSNKEKTEQSLNSTLINQKSHSNTKQF